jgi:hypothetical protein
MVIEKSKKKNINKKMKSEVNERPVFPFVSIIGQEEILGIVS